MNSDNNKEDAHIELAAVGGIKSLSNGEWFLKLVGRALRAYKKNGNAKYFREKYPSMDDDTIAKKLISIAAKNAGLIGGASGAAMTADELAALASLGLSTPASIAVAAGIIGADIVSVTHIQLKLIAALASLYGESLDPEDPEDVLLVIHYFIFGKAADAAGGLAAKAGGRAAGVAAKRVFSKETLKIVQAYGNAVGVKILQRSIRNTVIPVVSIGLGAGSNYLFTKSLGKKVLKDMKSRGAERRRYAVSENSAVIL